MRSGITVEHTDEDGNTVCTGCAQYEADMEAATLMQKKDLWDDFKKYPRADWRAEVANDDTQLGYWDWVKQHITLHG